jgi:tRNA uridine 5-carboxymethylaminomethyl modification enzyme
VLGSTVKRYGREKAKDLAKARVIVMESNATPNELDAHGLYVNKDGVRRTAAMLLSYANITWEQLEVIWPAMKDIAPAIRTQIEIDSLYAGYMGRHDADVEAFRKDENLKLPEALDYATVGSLSTEIRQKLERVRPTTLGEAARIPGVTPAAVIALLRFVKKGDHKKDAA